MNQGLTQVDDGLGKLREAIATNEGITEDLAQKYGAHVLPIGKPTFLNLVDLIRGQIATAPDVALPQDLLDNLPAILKELAVATNSYVAQVGSANAGYAAPSLMALLLSILLRLQPVLNWGSLPTEDKVPSAVVRRYRDLQKAFEGLEEDLRNLSQHKDQAQKVLGGIESVMTAGQSFAQNLDQLKVDATTAAERAQAAATTSTSSLEQITNSLQKVNETAAIVSAAAEKAGTAGTQIDETAAKVNTLLGQVGTNADNAAKSEQRLMAAAEEAAKAREKSIADSEAVAKLLADATKDGTETSAKNVEAEKILVSVRTATEETLRAQKKATEQATEAEGWAKKSKDAYRIVTAAGLAGAFHQRAERLTQVSWLWVFVLGAALAIAFVMGVERSKEITALLGANKLDPTVILIQVVLSVLTVGAPIWMAWFATKQIGHIFRLAEDYGYKASIAKAYEGFRDEAVKLDEQFSARLFATALQRMDENPLRFVSDTQPGSPMQELFNQPFFQDAIVKMPSFKEQFIAFLRGKGGLSHGTTQVGAKPEPGKSA